MKEDNQIVYICDLYNKYSSDKVVDVFNLNGRWWAIKEVKLEWGIPKLNNIEEDNSMPFHIYNTLQEAQKYVRLLKKMEGSPL